MADAYSRQRSLFHPYAHDLTVVGSLIPRAALTHKDAWRSCPMVTVTVPWAR